MGREKHKSPFIETEDDFSQFNSVNIKVNENKEENKEDDFDDDLLDEFRLLSEQMNGIESTTSKSKKATVPTKQGKREFKISTKPWDEAKVYKKTKFTIKPGITVLVGCNGCGKTTFLHSIKDQLRELRIPVFDYNNYSTGGHRAMESALFYGRMDILATQACSSEGENIVINMGQVAERIGRFIKEHPEDDELWILLDAIDSGLSIDNMEDLNRFFYFIFNDKESISRLKLDGKELYLVISTNSYEFCTTKNAKCFDVQNGKYIKIESYDDFKNHVLKTRKQKDEWIEEYNAKNK